jgi:NADPH-dependent curcumin reductase CurA
VIASTAIVLASRPHGEPTLADFRLESRPVRPLHDGEVLLRTIYLSLDPYMRGRMNAAKSYATPVQLGEVMEGGTVSEVIRTRHSDLTPGDIVLSRNGWQTHAVAGGAGLRRLDAGAAPLSAYLGLLGMPGFAAYIGVEEIGRPQQGETFVVAAATGAVGAAAGQFAKLRGARVVGIAGGARKVAWMADEGGFDVALDHRSATFADDLAAAVPDGIDVYFENVGGAVWDAVFPHLNDFARVPLCGLVSQYNRTEPSPGPDRLPELMSAININRMTVRGFTQRDFVDTLSEQFQRDVSRWWSQGRLRYLEDVVDGIENAPAAFLGMLRGENFGKLVVRVGSEPPPRRS